MGLRTVDADHNRPLRLIMEGLHSCSGCEMAFLNIGEPLMDLLERLELVHMPLLMDHKYRGPGEDGEEIQLPRADIGLVSGAVATREQQRLLETLRDRCEILVALGTCATHGGIPAMMNEWGMEAGTALLGDSSSSVSPVLDRVYAVDELVVVDLLVPGCPPRPQMMAGVLTALLEGKEVVQPTRSVCDTCPTRRQGKGEVRRLKRLLRNCRFNARQPVDRMRCLLEQGFLCLGPVTAAGCADETAPACMNARVACRGCFGPVRREGNQMVDMMNGLASNGIDYRSLPDRRSLLRFSGAHGRLRPLKKRGKND